MSWEVIKGIREGEQNAKASARAKRRGAKLAGGAGSRTSKHAGARSAGRAAISKMKSRGRGISIQVHKNGKSFKNRLDYANQPGKNAELIFSNGDINSMQACAKRRPDIKNPVGHVSISLPEKTGRLTKKEWQEILKTVKKEYGLDETFPIQVWRHNDTNRDHIHIIFSRISVLGKCHDAQNSAYRAAEIERIIEDHHNLPLVPPSEFKSHNSKLTKNEIELAVRTQQKPARLQIADALKIAIQNKPTTAQFVERLNAAGVGVRANISTSGKMSGFSFTHNDVEFKSSQIDRKFGWKQLSERIQYDETRDREYLAELDGSTGSAGDELAQLTAITDQLVESLARISTTAPDVSADISSGAPVIDRTIQPLSQTTKPANRRADAPVAATRKPAAKVALAAPTEPARLITPIDLAAARWMRSARLLLDYRQALKSKIEIAELDRAAAAAGHDPADIVSAHAAALDKLPAEIVQEVLKNAPSDEMREYIQKEFTVSKTRFKDRESHDDQPGMSPK
jgi:hypothetical protein